MLYYQLYLDLTLHFLLLPEVESAKYQEEWRHEYMTLQEKYEEYFEEGREDAKIEIIKNMLSKSISIEEIAELLNISVDEVKRLS